MGEVAEMMLDGTLCSQCGDFLGEGDGFPGLCRACERERRNDERTFRKGTVKPHACPECGKRFRKQGSLRQHRRDAHGWS